MDQENLPESLKLYEAAFKVYEEIRHKSRLVYNKINRGHILWRMGHYNEVQLVFDDLNATVSAPGSEFKHLKRVLLVAMGGARLSQRNYDEAIRFSNEGLALAGKDEEVAIQGLYTLGLAKAFSGDRNGSLKLCRDAVTKASNSGDFTLLSRALLAEAEAALVAKDAGTALKMAIEAQTRFARGSQFASEWRAWMVASKASDLLGDKATSEAQLRNAQSVRSRMEAQWGAEEFRRYSSRPDIQAYTQ
jgi:tetratricopeptide (TPR) repeat protein